MISYKQAHKTFIFTQELEKLHGGHKKERDQTKNSQVSGILRTQFINRNIRRL